MLGSGTMAGCRWHQTRASRTVPQPQTQQYRLLQLVQNKKRTDALPPMNTIIHITHTRRLETES